MDWDTSMKLLGYAVLFGYASRGHEGIKSFVKQYVGIEVNSVGNEFRYYCTKEQGEAALRKCASTGY